MNTQQIAALPYRINADGTASILLITSRDTRRWVIPKGNHMRGIGPHQAAEVEAFEECVHKRGYDEKGVFVFGWGERRRRGAARTW